MRKTFVAVLLLIVTSLFSAAQQPTGSPQFDSFQKVAPGVLVNLGNLDVHVSVPIFARNGNGLPFSYSWEYDNEIWYDNGTGWHPTNGWSGLEGVPVQYSLNYGDTRTTYGTCTDGQTSYQLSNFVWVDPSNTAHSFPSIQVQNDCGPWARTGSGSSSDGYLMNVDDTTFPPVVTVTSPSGTLFQNGSTKDTNNNTVSVAFGSNYTYTDTLGTTALTTGGQTGNSNYVYSGEAGSEQVSKTTTSKGIASAFGCTGPQYGPITGFSMVTGFSLPDSSSYTIGYEATPGNPTYTTGRISSLRLPAGGTVSFSYNGSNNGMNCDGSTSGMTVATPDGTWTYVHTVPNASHVATTTVTDPAGNVTTYSFYQNGSVGPYEVQRVTNTGSSTKVQTVVTCYNGQTTNCATAPTAFTSVSEVTKYIQLPDSSGIQAKEDYTYDSSGRLTNQKDYDYGASSAIRSTGISYGDWNGSACVALSGNISDRPCVIQTYSGTTLEFQAYHHYDSHGNLLQLTTPDGQGHWLAKYFTYNANGATATFQDVDGGVFTYSNFVCNGAFPTTVSEPHSLSRSMSWDCTGGVITSTSDESGKSTTINHTGEYFWRPSSTVDAMAHTISYAYSPTSLESTLNFGSSTVDNLTTLDSSGRPHVIQRRQAPGSGNFDSVEIDYNNLGLRSRVTQPYSAAAGVTNGSAPATTYTYADGLHRLTQVADSGGGSVQLAYTKNDILKTVNGQPAGENPKKWNYEYDSAGQLIRTCEITSAAGSGGCGQNVAYTGFYTASYRDPLERISNVYMNAQAGSAGWQPRTFSYDYLGRLLSETNPETGTTTYTYDTVNDTGIGCTVNAAGNLVEKTDARGDKLCLSWQVGHRLASIGSGGPDASITPDKCFVYDAATVNGTAMSNVGNRLAEAFTAAHASGCATSKITDEGFSYDADGRLTDFWENTPHSGGYYHVTDQFFPNGIVNTLVGVPGLPTITYLADAQGRPTTVNAGSGQNPVTSVSYNTADEITNVTFGSADSDVYGYDANTGRMTSYQFNVNGSSVNGTLTWNANGTLKTLAITDPFNSGDVQTCNYGYDDLSRLVSANCGTPWSQTFSYDFYGNLTKSGSLSFSPGYSSATNRYTSLPGLSYDADGRLLNDSFHTYTWSASNEILSVDSNAITHDALGRIVEVVGGTTREFLYAPIGAKIAKMNGQTLDTANVPLPGGGFANYHASLSAYGHADWLGSIRFGSTTGRVKDSDYAFAPFGEVYAGSITSYTHFTGQRDGDLGSNLFDFPMREYHSSQGRWINPDPAGVEAVNPMNPQTWNRYAYLGGSPLAAVDPTGLCDPNDSDPNCSLLPGSVIVTGSGTVDSPSISTGEEAKIAALSVFNLAMQIFSQAAHAIMNAKGDCYTPNTSAGFIGVMGQGICQPNHKAMALILPLQDPEDIPDSLKLQQIPMRGGWRIPGTDQILLRDPSNGVLYFSSAPYSQSSPAAQEMVDNMIPLRDLAAANSGSPGMPGGIQPLIDNVNVVWATGGVEYSGGWAATPAGTQLRFPFMSYAPGEGVSLVGEPIIVP